MDEPTTVETPDVLVPAHVPTTVPWSQTVRSGTRADRTVTEIVASIPPAIASVSIDLPTSVASAAERAMREITALDRSHADVLTPLGVLLLRTESVASSKIEHIEADLDDYARALHGNRSNPSATAMVGATEALRIMIDQVGAAGSITLASLTRAQRVLMADDPVEARDAGRFREVQNWIGGSDHSPRGALFVPPPPERVAALMDDLVRFTNRRDLPVLVLGAIAHAQFESIHPFTDGNGRIGRALVNALLRTHGSTSGVVVPTASALVADRRRYFDDLTAYRSGAAGPIVESLIRASGVAAREAQRSAVELRAIPDRWRDAVGPYRRGSAIAALLDAMPTQPVFSAEDASDVTGVVSSSLYAALARLEDAEVIRPLTDRKRNQVWGAVAILDEIDDLGMRIAAASV